MRPSKKIIFISELILLRVSYFPDLFNKFIKLKALDILPTTDTRSINHSACKISKVLAL